MSHLQHPVDVLIEHLMERETTIMILFECGHVRPSDAQMIEEKNYAHHFKIRLPKLNETCFVCAELSDSPCTLADVLEFSHTAYDHSVNRNFVRERDSPWRWEIDVVYLQAIFEAYEAQKDERLYKLIYRNHYHNAKRIRWGVLEKIQKKREKHTREDQDDDMETSFKKRTQVIELDFARDEGNYLGRAWADLVKERDEMAVGKSSSFEETEATMIRYEKTETTVTMVLERTITVSTKRTKTVKSQANRVQKRPEKEKKKLIAQAATPATPVWTGSLRDLYPSKYKGTFSTTPNVGRETKQS